MAAANANDRELNSWKEIANFLGVSERTAQKWEEERGLPIKRLPGVKGRVTTTAAALETWKKSNLKKIPWHANVRFLRFYAGAATLLIAILLGIQITRYFAGHRTGPPAQYQVESNALIVKDTHGKEVWRWLFERPFQASAYMNPSYEETSRKAWFGSLRLDKPDTNTLFVYYPAIADTKGSSLYSFSSTGQKEWDFIPGKEIEDGKGRYKPFFVITDFHVTPLTTLIRGGERNKILITSHHFDQDPNQFAILDDRGTLTAEYWHAGYLTHMETADLNGDGIEEILLAGVNNGYHSVILLELDPRNVQGAFQQEADDPLQLKDFPRGTEMRAVLFPRSCIAMKMQYNNLAQLVATKDTVEIVTFERATPILSAEIRYIMNRNLDLKDVQVSDEFIRVHREMESHGELNHRYAEDDRKQLKKNVRRLR